MEKIKTLISKFQTHSLRLTKIEEIKEKFLHFYEETLSDETFPAEFKMGKGNYPSTPFGTCQHHTYPVLNAITKIVKPKNSLEIGSWLYNSAYAICHGMDGGRVDSFDIALGGCLNVEIFTIKSHRIIPHFWRPHHTWYDEWKNESEKIIYKDFKEMSNEEIFDKNRKYLSLIAPEEGYDLISIDGDHSFDGTKFDWEYAHTVAHENTIIIIDDIYTHCHPEVRKFYDSLHVNSYDFYDFNMEHPEIFVNASVCSVDLELLNSMRSGS